MKKRIAVLFGFALILSVSAKAETPIAGSSATTTPTPAHSAAAGNPPGFPGIGQSLADSASLNPLSYNPCGPRGQSGPSYNSALGIGLGNY